VRTPAFVRAALGLLALSAAGLAVWSCGGSSPTTPTPQPPVVAPPAPPPAPPPPNTAPIISALTAQGTREREPANLADANEEIVLTAAVTDAETATDKLTFEWSSPAGTFTGTGPTVRWRAPAGVPAPFVATLQLRVVDGDQRVDRTVAVQVHDHAREVGDMATLFLRDFADNSVPVTAVMRNFLPDCYGTEDEAEDVEKDRRFYTHVRTRLDPPEVTVDFGGTCPYENRPGDACSSSFVRWETRKTNGETEIVEGHDQVAAVYRQDRWWLCDSKFDGRKVGGTSTGFLELLRRR
jgi:hypothetical protein